MHVAAAELIEGLRRLGFRITVPRRAVCEVLAGSHDEHLTATDIQQRAAAVAGASIDLSTVYRTLDALEEAGFLHHVHLGHGPGVVHLSEQRDHHHLVCEECGRTVDVPLAELGPLLRHVEDRYGFLPDSVHFALVGRCSEHR